MIRPRSSRDSGIFIENAFSLLALICFALAQFLRFQDWNLEDAYIIFRIVRNLISGDGWVFNVGESFNPSTSVLHTLVLFLCTPSAATIPMTAHVLGALYLAGIGGSVFLILRRQGNSIAALCCSLSIIYFLSERHTWGFGLETYLFIFLLTLFVLLEIRGRTSWEVLGLITLARPDGLALVGLRWIWSLIRQHTASLWGLLRFALILAPWIAFSLWKFGQVFPSTLGNKIWQGSSGYWGTGWVYLSELIKHVLETDAPMTFVYAAATISLIWWRSIPSPVWFVFGFAALQQITYVTLNVPGYLWYFSILDFSALLAASFLLCRIRLVTFAGKFAPHRRRIRSLAAAALAIACLIWLYLAPSRQRAFSGNEHYVAASRYLESAHLPPGPLAAVEVGTLGFGTERPIIDLIGLTSPNPEYLTGRHLQNFFARPAEIIVLHSPPWDMEQALADDPRLALMYDGPVVLSGPNVQLQYYTLRSDAEAFKEQNPEQLVRAKFPGFRLQTLESQVDPDIHCVVDSIQGRPEYGHRVRLRAPFLSLRWRLEELTVAAAPAVVLTSRDKKYFVSSAPAQADRDHFTARLHLLDVPPGRYKVQFLLPEANRLAQCNPDLEIELPRLFLVKNGG